MAKSRTAKSNLFRVFEQSLQPVYVLDDERDIIFCNQALSDWVAEPIEIVTTWRCDFHSGSQPGENSSKAAQLCPPLDVFGGIAMECQISRGCGTGQMESRNAFCQPLGQIDGKQAVLVIVDANPAPPTKLDTQNFSGNIPLMHNLLKRLQDEVNGNDGLESVLGKSPTSLRLRRQISCFMNSPLETLGDILIVGPNGSGRRKIAETIHYGGTQRSGIDATGTAALVPIESALCDPEMIQSTIREIFASPGSRHSKMLLLNADKLDEPSQIELRGFFEMPDFKLSVIATAAQPLMELIETGFDESLAMRLSTLVVEIPPLVRRKSDISLLVQAQVEKFNSRGGRQLGGANKAAMQLLVDYHWPDDFNELAETIEAACKKATGPNIVKDDLPKRLIQAESAREYSPKQATAIDLAEYLRAIESELIERALAQCDGNKTQAAKILGLSRASLLRRLEQIKGHDDG